MSVPVREISGGAAVPDVDALMRRVRAGVADKLGSGAYTPAELDEVRRLESRLHERADSGPAPADDLVLLHSAVDPLGPYTFTSHRAGLGGLVVAAKRWLRRLVRPVAAVTLVRQAEFNGAVARLLDDAARGVRSLEADHAALLRRLDELERRNLELAARCRLLQAQVRGQRSADEPGGCAGKPG